MPASPETQAVGLLRTIALTSAQYRAFQAAPAELEGYSERELGELGIARRDIAGIAYAEAERRVEAPAPGRPALGPPSPDREPEAAAA